MSIQTRLIEYGGEDMRFEAMMAWDDAIDGPRPGVVVSHTIRGRTEFEEQKARELAELGYVGFALDVYGAPEIGHGNEKGRTLMNALLADRPELQRRLLLSLSTMCEQSEVAADKVAAIGYCFGGLCVLDLARIGAPVAGVVSLHGLFGRPDNIAVGPIGAKVLALHGWDDPLAKPQSVLVLSDEMTAAKADWQLHAYGGTTHAFTNPNADDAVNGIEYNANADRRSRIATENFLSELFA